LNIKSHNGRAFTLIEMILAVGMTAIVMLAVSSVLFTALHLRNTTQAMVDAEVPLDTTFTLMRRDLQCMMSPTTNGIFAGDFKAGNVSSPGISQPVAVEMYTATGALSENKPWGDVQKVTYELRLPTDRSLPGRDLVRSVTRNILATSTIDVDDQWMMGGVDSMTITCFDGNQWQNAWDTTDTTSVNTNLPLAVRVEIQLAGQNNGNQRPAPITFLVPIDSQSRTNS
jgi:type II secretion system protein J